jgi:hypothetical protein
MREKRPNCTNSEVQKQRKVVKDSRYKCVYFHRVAAEDVLMISAADQPLIRRLGQAKRARAENIAHRQGLTVAA